MSEIKVVWSVMMSMLLRWVGSERVLNNDSKGEKVGLRNDASPTSRQHRHLKVSSLVGPL